MAGTNKLKHPYLAFLHELCISCGRCVRVCDEMQGAFALTATGRGFESTVTSGLESGLLYSHLCAVWRVLRHD